MFSCQTEFRFYWRQQKLDEIPDLSVQSKSNPVGIVYKLKTKVLGSN